MDDGRGDLPHRSAAVVAATLTAGLALGLEPEYLPWRMALLFTVMGLGLTCTDVLADARMVEHGRRWQRTGAFQSGPWASTDTASGLVGIGGGALSGRGLLQAARARSAWPPFSCLLVPQRRMTN